MPGSSPCEACALPLRYGFSPGCDKRPYTAEEEIQILVEKWCWGSYFSKFAMGFQLTISSPAPVSPPLGLSISYTSETLQSCHELEPIWRHITQSATYMRRKPFQRYNQMISTIKELSAFVKVQCLILLEMLTVLDSRACNTPACSLQCLLKRKIFILFISIYPAILDKTHKAQKHP